MPDFMDMARRPKMLDIHAINSKIMSMISNGETAVVVLFKVR